MRRWGSKETPRPRLATWGTFDVANYGDLLFPRILEQEIRRRLPDAVVRAFSPQGERRAVSHDGGHVAETLGPWSMTRIHQLAHEADLVAIGGGEIIHPHDEYYAEWYDTGVTAAARLRPSAYFVEGLGNLESDHPVAWHAVGVPHDLEGDFAGRVVGSLRRRAYVSVRDELSKRRLEQAGVERPIEVVPDPAFLLRRSFPLDVVGRRLAYLRAIGSYPPDVAPLVVQGSAALLPHVDEIARGLAATVAASASLPVVLLATGPCHGDERFADALARRLGPQGVQRLPACFVVEDVLAAIAHARAFVGVSLHGCITAFVHDVPFAVLDFARYSKLGTFAHATGAEGTLVSSPAELQGALGRVLDGARARVPVAGLAARVDAHFDRLAELVTASAEDSRPEPERRSGGPRRGVASVRDRPDPSQRKLASSQVRGRTTPVASIVIPTHGGWRWTRRALEALPEVTDAPYELIVCDNASTDETPKRLAEWRGADAAIVLNERNLGFAAACNQGAALALAPVLVFLNSDAIPGSGWLAPLVERLSADRGVGAVGPRFLNLDGSLQEAGASVLDDLTILRHGNGGDAEAPEFAFPREVDYVSGACLATRRRTFHEVGGFDVAFGLGYFEDVDLCFRLRDAGYRVMYEPRSVVTHVGGASTDDSTRRDLVSHGRRVWAKQWGSRLEERRAGEKR